jgi:hypothetical protein
MSRYDKDVFEKRIHGKANLKVGTSGSSGFEESDVGNAISASYFFGDGSGLTGVSGGGGTVNSFSTIAVSGESDVVAGSSTDTLTLVAGSNVSITTDAGTDSITINSSGGGGTTYQFWDPMAPPSSANSLDDEFTGSLGVQWSTWNPGSVDLTASVDTNKLLLINNTINGGDSYAGIYMNAPTASSGDYDYSYWTKVSWFSEGPTNFPQLGLIAANDIQGSPTTAGFWSFVVVKESSVFRATSYIFNNYASYNTQNFEAIYQPSIYLRIRISYDSTGNQTTGYFDYSNNGVGWSRVYARTQSGHIPFIGLVSNNAQGSKPLWGVFDFFRVYSGSNFYSFPSGSYADRTLS